MELSERAATETADANLEEMVRTFKEALSGPDPVVRYLAVTGLYRVAKANPELITAEELVGILERASQDEDNTVRMVAGYYRERLGGNPAAVQAPQGRDAQEDVDQDSGQVTGTREKIIELERIVRREDSCSFDALSQLRDMVEGLTDPQLLERIIRITDSPFDRYGTSGSLPEEENEIVPIYEALRADAMLRLSRIAPTQENALRVLERAVGDRSLWVGLEALDELESIAARGDTSPRTIEKIIGLMGKLLNDGRDWGGANLCFLDLMYPQACHKWPLRFNTIYSMHHIWGNLLGGGPRAIERLIGILENVSIRWAREAANLRFPECGDNRDCIDYRAGPISSTRSTALGLLNDLATDNGIDSSLRTKAESAVRRVSRVYDSVESVQ